MAFSLSGSTITQSGTDTDLSGLASISGVSVQTTSSGVHSYSVYDLNSLTLVINGTLTINPEENMLLVSATSGRPYVDVKSGGNLRIGAVTTLNGVDRNALGTAIYFTHDLFTGWDASGACLAIRSGGRLDWFSGEMSAGGPQFNWGAGATIRIYHQDAVWRFRSKDPQTRTQLRTSATDVEVDGFPFINGDCAFLAAPTRFDGYRPQHASGALGFSGLFPNVDFHLREYAGGGNGNENDVKFWSGNRCVLTNTLSGTDAVFKS